MICRVFHVLSSGVLMGIFRRRVWEKNDAQNPFRQGTKLIVFIDHEFLGNSTSPPITFLSWPIHMDIFPPLKDQLTGVIWDTHGREKPTSKSRANAKLCTCEH